MAQRRTTSPPRSAGATPPRSGSPDGAGNDALSVGQLARMLKSAVEGGTPSSLLVGGELTNFKRHGSGHLYFSLRDTDPGTDAVIPAVMWRSDAARMRFAPADGMAVIARGRLGVYEPHGKVQLYVDRLQPAGAGAADAALRELVARLRGEGLLDPGRKRPLPFLPRRIAVVTSPAGAALQDILQVIRRRCPRVRVTVVPARVQGETAARELTAALAIAGRMAAPDTPGGPVQVVVLGRGGGSAEDLRAFDDEGLARAVAACPVPVVSAVGHETDVSVTDLVADVRALTPTEAAERCVPELAAVEARLDDLRARLQASYSTRMAAARRRVEQLARRRVFVDPRRLFERTWNRLDDLAGRAERAVGRMLERGAEETARAAGRLEALSPLGVLARGYALAVRADGAVLRRAADAREGERLRLRLAEGELPVDVAGPG